MGKIFLSGSNNDVDDILIGFDGMTDDEILFVAKNSPSPELMGKRVMQWAKKRPARGKRILRALSFALVPGVKTAMAVGAVRKKIQKRAKNRLSLRAQRNKRQNR